MLILVFGSITIWERLLSLLLPLCIVPDQLQMEVFQMHLLFLNPYFLFKQQSTGQHDDTFFKILVNRIFQSVDQWVVLSIVMVIWANYLIFNDVTHHSCISKLTGNMQTGIASLSFSIFFNFIIEYWWILASAVESAYIEHLIIC